MRQFKLVTLLFIGIFLLKSSDAWAKPRRVVMIALDGISIAGYKKARTPNLDALMAKGALSLTTQVVMPSATLPNWTSHLTGSGPELHGEESPRQIYL